MCFLGRRGMTYSCPEKDVAYQFLKFVSCIKAIVWLMTLRRNSGAGGKGI